MGKNPFFFEDLGGSNSNLWLENSNPAGRLTPPPSDRGNSVCMTGQPPGPCHPPHRLPLPGLGPPPPAAPQRLRRPPTGVLGRPLHPAVNRGPAHLDGGKESFVWGGGFLRFGEHPLFLLPLFKAQCFIGLSAHANTTPTTPSHTLCEKHISVTLSGIFFSIEI